MTEADERLAHQIRVLLTATELAWIEREARRRLERGIRDGKSGVMREALRRFRKTRTQGGDT